MDSSWKEIRSSIKKSAIYLFMFSLVATSSSLALPIYSLQIFDKVLTSQRIETLWMLLALFSIFSVLWVGFDRLRRRIPSQLFSYLHKTVRSELLKKECDGVFSEAGQRPSQTLVQLQKHLQHPCLISLTDALQAPLLMVFLYFLHPSFALLMLTGNIGYWLLIGYQQRSLSTVNRPVDKENVSQSQLIDARQFGYVDHLTTRFELELTSHFDNREVAHKIEGHFQSLSLALKVSILMALPTLGATLLLQQSITPGTLLAALIIGSRSLLPLESVLQQWGLLQQLLISLRLLKSQLESPNLDDRHQPLKTLSGHLTLKKQALRLEAKGLENISIHSGQRWVFIGANNSDLTTIMTTFMGQPSDADYRVWFDHYESQHLNSRWLNTQIGLSRALAPINSDSIRDYLSRFNLHQNSNIDVDRCLLQAMSWLELDQPLGALPYGDNTKLHEIANQPSLRWRLSLARAVYATPAIVVFDQMDKHCDSNELALFERLLERLSKAGTTVIVSSHRKSIMQAADRVLLLDKKDVVFTGKPSELPEVFSRKASQQTHTAPSTAANQSAHNIDSVVALSQRGIS